MDEIKQEKPIENDQDNTHSGKDRIVFRGVQSVVGIAILTATILTLWNPRSFMKTPDIQDLFQSATQEQEILSESVDQVTQIGIVSGHWQDKPGNVCRDGTSEHDVNYGIAYQLQIFLESEGYRVDLFPEFDEALFGYQADALIAVYAGSCEDNPLPPSGFRIGSSLTVENLNAVDTLSTCLAASYQQSTGLPYYFEVVDIDHPSYHIFRDISADTPAVRFEIGALSTNSDLIFKDSGAIVKGISDGLACYLEASAAGG